MYNNIIDVEKSEREPLTHTDIARINDRFMYAFYCGLPSDIWTLVGKRNDLSLTEIYEIVEKANQELKMRYESQQAYTSSCRFVLRAASDTLRNRPQ